MYSYLQPDIGIFGSEKIALRLGLLVLATAVFSAQSMTMDVYETGEVLKGYIQENTMLKEQSDDALFLLREKRNKQLAVKYAGNKIKHIEEGVDYVSLIKYVNTRRVKIHVTEADRTVNPDLEILPQMAGGKMHAKSKINVIASGALAAVNGTYFKQDTGTSLGTLVINNEIMSGPIYNRVALGIGKNDFKTARISFEGEISGLNGSVKINNINQPRMMHSQVLMYNQSWGARSPVSNKPVKNIAVKDNVIVAISSKPLIIPFEGYVISAPKEILNGFSLGDKVQIKYSLTPEWKDIPNIISGGPYLIKNGKIYIDTAEEKLAAIEGRNPRTAVGYTKDNVMIIVTVDGRKEGSSGVTLKELAYIMKNLGCYEAINLDGGSSTVMYAAGNLYSGSNIKSASVSNALVVRKKV